MTRLRSFTVLFHILPMTALLSMLIISALLLGVIALVAQVVLGE